MEFSKLQELEKTTLKAFSAPSSLISSPIVNANLASAFYDRLSNYIIEFEKDLESNEELAIRLVSFGESIIINVDDIGYHNPSLISFTGTTSSGARVKLVQHVSQISFLLMATKSAEPIPERNRVGFKLKHERDVDKR